MRMNRIKEINAGISSRWCSPGSSRKDCRRRWKGRDCFIRLTPPAGRTVHIGGNIATNAGGPRCLKYGVTRDYVLGLEVVLADGTVVAAGQRTHKNKTGFDLARLFAGSEGLLGVVTEATLKLLPLPPFRACLAIGFASMKDAAADHSRHLCGRISAMRAGNRRRLHAGGGATPHQKPAAGRLPRAFDRGAGRTGVFRAPRDPVAAKNRARGIVPVLWKRA